jgi:hypothetical protein
VKSTEGRFLPAAEDLWVIACGVVACFVALWAAMGCYNGALKELDKLED